MMKRLSIYIGLALAACMSCFSISAIASGPGYYIARTMRSIGEMPMASIQKMELTLAHWRMQDQTITGNQLTDMRSASNGFVFNSIPVPGLMPEPLNT